MAAPIIGITTYGRNAEGRFHLPGEYVDAVRAAGGLPVLLAPGENKVGEILNFIDGLMLAGGGDIDPATYNGHMHPSIDRVDRERDQLELALAEKVFETETPVFGICRGQQILNIATGGNLIEHLPEKYGEEIIHRGDGGEEVAHPVQIEPGSVLSDILGDAELPTMSKHHQAIDRVSSGWHITARSIDGVIEAQEHKHHPWMIAVQWHPELSYQDPRHLKLFIAHVDAADQYRQHKKNRNQ